MVMNYVFGDFFDGREGFCEGKRERFGLVVCFGVIFRVRCLFFDLGFRFFISLF